MQESFTLDPGSFLFPGLETNDGRSLLRISGLKKKKKKGKNSQISFGAGKTETPRQNGIPFLFALWKGKSVRRFTQVKTNCVT